MVGRAVPGTPSGQISSISRSVLMAMLGESVSSANSWRLRGALGVTS
jgi:hypothetical protein